MVKYLQTIVDSLPADKIPTALNSFNRALNVETTLMLVTTLAAGHNWKSRSLVIPDATLQFLCDSASTFPNLTWVDGFNKGELTINDVIERSSVVAAAILPRLFVRLDLRGKDTTMFGYDNEENYFYVAAAREASYGDQPYMNYHELRPSYRYLWGRTCVTTIDSAPKTAPEH